MEINRAQLQTILQKYTPKFLSALENNVKIKDFMYLVDQSLPLESNILYICKSSEFPTTLSNDQIVNLLCLEDISLPANYKEYAGLNLILLDKNTNLFAVFNDIKKVLTTDLLVSANSLRLLESLAQVNGLQRILEIGYEMLGNPFSIMDMSYKSLAITNNPILNDDPVWNELVTKGYLSFDTLSFYATNKLSEMVDKSEAPFFWTDTYSKYPRIMGQIKIGKKQIASIGVCAHQRPFKESDLELTSLICKAISIELQKNEFIYYSRGLMHESFTEDLLGGKITDEKVISERIKTLNINYKKNLFVLTIDVKKFANSQISLTYMRNKFENAITHSKAVVHAEKIVMIISYDHDEPTLKKQLESLKDFLKTNNMYAGISRRFNSLVEVKSHYVQSLEALKLGLRINKEAVLFRYEDYAIYHLTDIFSSTGNPKENCHPALLKLIEYDRENSTNYTRSLYTYIISSKNITESASSLDIHRNTMQYRIGKIETIMDIDLNNSDILLHLHLSFKILEFLKISLP